MKEYLHILKEKLEQLNEPTVKIIDQNFDNYGLWTTSVEGFSYIYYQAPHYK